MFVINDQRYSQVQILRRMAEVADSARDYRWRGRRVAVCTTDPAEWLAIALYCRDSGTSVAPLHPDTPPAVAAVKAQALGCRWLICQTIERLIQLPGDDSAPPGALMQFSSGTTGAPKPVLRLWSDIGVEITHYNAQLDLDPAVTPIVACPVTHSYGLICGVLAPLLRGVQPHIVTSLNPRHLLSVLARYEKPMIYSSPQLLHTLVQLLPPGQKIHAAMSSGSLLPPPWFECIRSGVQHFYQQYGCSEAGCLTIARNPVSANTLGSALPHWRVTAGNGIEQPAEIIASNDRHTVNTSDLGYFDEQQQLHFCSRLDDTIVVAGHNVYPADVEAVLLQHPDIADTAVFRFSHSDGSDRVAAVYCAADDISAQALRKWCNGQLARFQWPTLWQRVPAIERLPNGKLSRRELARSLRTRLDPTPPATLAQTEVI